MVMKKVVASALAVATMALAFAGCGKKDDKKFIVGVALGYAGPEFAANAVLTGREEVSTLAQFYGF